MLPSLSLRNVHAGIKSSLAILACLYFLKVAVVLRDVIGVAAYFKYKKGDFTLDMYNQQVDWETFHLRKAAKNGVRIESGEVYITASPCWSCFKILANTGIKKIYYGEFYRDERIFDVAKRLGIELMHIPVDQKEL